MPFELPEHLLVDGGHTLRVGLVDGLVGAVIGGELEERAPVQLADLLLDVAEVDRLVLRAVHPDLDDVLILPAADEVHGARARGLSRRAPWPCR